MARKKKIVDALSPLDAITQVVARLMLLLIAIAAVSVIVDATTSVIDVSPNDVCVDADFTLPDFGEDAAFPSGEEAAAAYGGEDQDGVPDGDQGVEGSADTGPGERLMSA